MKHIKFYLLSIIFITQTNRAFLPDFGIFTSSCYIYATMTCLCCSDAIRNCRNECEYNKVKSSLATIENGVSRINVNLMPPQTQRMCPNNSKDETPPSLQQLKHTTNQESNTDLSLITPPLPRRSLDKKPQTPPLLKEVE